MKVILLAAGVGRRFGKRTKTLPKCLIPFDKKGSTLLLRYLDTFRALGLKDVVIVVGHQKDKIKKECIKRGRGLNIHLIFNKNYRQGSVVSLHTASKEFNDDCLIMDADVYFETVVLRKLIHSKNKTAFLIDTKNKSTGEEMMLMAKGGRPWAISKKVDPSLKILGEASGFLKVSNKDAIFLKKILAEFVRKKNVNVEYEEAYNFLMRKRKVSFETMGSHFWTEMDFEEDLLKIREYLKP